MAENQLILIADDFGLSSGVNKAILELLALGRLSGTSVMANMPHFVDGASDLAACHAQADIGLHLTLTLGNPISPMPHLAPDQQFPTLKTVMARALSFRLNQQEIANEIKAQIKCFRDQLGFMPVYIDGHQHVHILPIIRAALFDAVRSFPNFTPWIRCPSDHGIAIIQRGISVQKSLVLAALSLGFRQQCQSYGLKTNHSFSGTSDFDTSQNFEIAFKAYLKSAGPRHLVMCHPGYVEPNEDLQDSVKGTRPIEFEFLRSDRFRSILSQQNFKIARFS